MSVPAVAGFALGVFVGFLVWYFIVRLQTFTIAGLTSLVGIIAGGAVIKLIEDNVKGSGIAWYLIGLLVGFLLYYGGRLVSDGRAGILKRH